MFLLIEAPTVVLDREFGGVFYPEDDMAGKLKALDAEREVRPGKYADGDGLYLVVTGPDPKNWSFRRHHSGAPGDRKTRLQKFLGKTQDGIQYNDHMEGGGAVVFEHACRFGHEGIVAKRKDLPYESGRSKRWVKIKNPDSPAMKRVLLADSTPLRFTPAAWAAGNWKSW